MKSLTKILGLASMALITGCATMTPAQKTALLGQSLSILGSINTPSNNTVEGNRAKEILKTSGNLISNQAKMQHDLEYANAGKSEIIINNNVPNNNQTYSNNGVNYQNSVSSPKSSSQYHTVPEGFFMFSKNIDFGQDGITHREDLIGFNQPVYDLSNLDKLYFAFFGGGKMKYKDKGMDFRIYDTNTGEMIVQYNTTSLMNKIRTLELMNELFPKGGEYRATLNVGDFDNFFIDFNVIK